MNKINAQKQVSFTCFRLPGRLFTQSVHSTPLMDFCSFYKLKQKYNEEVLHYYKHAVPHTHINNI